MGDTKIEWAEKTWNPIRARRISNDERGWYCEHVSEGCRNCYAEKMNRNTYFGNGLPYKPATLPEVELFLDEKILQQPLHWSKPQNVFPCSMTDLFGRWVKDEWLDRIFAVIANASQHTFQILTKRPERMQQYLNDLPVRMGRKPDLVRYWKHVWFGTSVEDQNTADERIPLLLQTPAAVRWISAEPLLGPIDVRNLRAGTFNGLDGIDYEEIGDIRDPGILSKSEIPKLDWVVCGGESGPKARPMHPDWARSLRDQCVSAGVPFFFKQWGEWVPTANVGFGDSPRAETHVFRTGEVVQTYGGPVPFGIEMRSVGKKAAGRLLDGKEWNEYPKEHHASVL
jgi:protein gp37